MMSALCLFNEINRAFRFSSDLITRTLSERILKFRFSLLLSTNYSHQYCTKTCSWKIIHFIMHQSIPAAPTPPKTSPPGILCGICLTFQSRGWGICKFCVAQGPGICQPRGYSRAFDTHAVSYQDITTQRILRKKSRLAHLSRTGGCRGMFSISCLDFFIAYQARIASGNSGAIDVNQRSKHIT